MEDIREVIEEVVLCDDLCPRLNLNLNIPNHSNELSRAEYKIEKARDKFNKIVIDGTITDKIHGELYEEVISSLDYVGKLSKPIFALEDEIEQAYTMAYIHCPDQVLVKRTWYMYYEELHQQYSILKNRCFKLLDELDEEYIARFNSKPSNYNY